MDFARIWEGTEQIRAMVTVQQVCALAALTVRKHRLEGKNPISEADGIFACNYEGTEQLRNYNKLEYIEIPYKVCYVKN